MSTAIAPAMLPSEDDIQLARTSSRELSALLTSMTKTQPFDFKDDKGQTRTVHLPVSALQLLVKILVEMGHGNAVAIRPVRAEVTTQEAADLLNVSRPYLVQLLEKGKIPHRKVNTHRRVLYQDVLDYKQQIDTDRHAALDEMAAQAQELGLGY